MASREENTPSKEDIRRCDFEDVVDVVIEQLEIEVKDARDLKKRLMVTAGYDVKPQYIKPEKKDERKRRFFDGDDDSDDGDL